MRKHSVILDMSCDKLGFWPGHCEHSDIKRKTSTAEKKVEGIALALSLSKLIRDQDKALVQKSGKIILESILKIGEKEVPASQGFLHTNFGVCRPKEGVTPKRKILKREPNTNMKKNEISSTRNLLALLSHVLPNVYGYQCVSKEIAKEPPPRYIVPQKQLRALSSVTSGVSQSEEKEPL